MIHHLRVLVEHLWFLISVKSTQLSKILHCPGRKSPPHASCNCCEFHSCLCFSLMSNVPGTHQLFHFAQFDIWLPCHQWQGLTTNSSALLQHLCILEQTPLNACSIVKNHTFIGKHMHASSKSNECFNRPGSLSSKKELGHLALK